MNINATLVGQMISFGIFVGFTGKFVWPPLMKALADRQQKIADGLAAAERGVHELELAQHKVAEQLRNAKIQAAQIVEQAQKRAGQLVEDAKYKAREEGQHLLVLAKTEIDNMARHARDDLRKQVGRLAMDGAEKILERHLDSSIEQELIDKIITEI